MYRFALLFLILNTCFTANASSCYSYDVISKQKNTVIYEVSFSHIVATGSTFVENLTGDGQLKVGDFLILSFKTLKTIKGTERKTIYVKHQLGNVLFGQLPSYPDKQGEKYLVTYNESEHKNGEEEKPYIQTVCDVFKRI